MPLDNQAGPSVTTSSLSNCPRITCSISKQVTYRNQLRAEASEWEESVELLSLLQNVVERSHDSTVDIQEFSLFLSLPRELRLRIWALALPSYSLIRRVWNNDKFSHALQRRVPPVLQACSESRYELIGTFSALRFHQLQQREHERGYIYVNWKTDEVYIPRGCT